MNFAQPDPTAEIVRQLNDLATAAEGGMAAARLYMAHARRLHETINECALTLTRPTPPELQAAATDAAVERMVNAMQRSLETLAQGVNEWTKTYKNKLTSSPS